MMKHLIEQITDLLKQANALAETLDNYELSKAVWRQLSCPVRDNYDGRLGGLTFYSFQPA